MIIGPRLRDPTPSNTTTFLRWTKLHFRDLLNQPIDPTLGHQTKALRFAAPDEDPKYSHDESKGYSTYFYQCVLDDIRLVHASPYHEISRVLNLEKTRELDEGEEAVGYEKEDAMVFDLVDAKFAIFEEVESCKFIHTIYYYFSNIWIRPETIFRRI